MVTGDTIAEGVMPAHDPERLWDLRWARAFEDYEMLADEELSQWVANSR